MYMCACVRVCMCVCVGGGVFCVCVCVSYVCGCVSVYHCIFSLDIVVFIKWCIYICIYWRPSCAYTSLFIVCMHTYRYSCIYLFTSICIYISIYIKNSIQTYTLENKTTHQYNKKHPWSYLWYIRIKKNTHL